MFVLHLSFHLACQSPGDNSWFTKKANIVTVTKLSDDTTKTERVSEFMKRKVLASRAQGSYGARSGQEGLGARKSHTCQEQQHWSPGIQSWGWESAACRQMKCSLQRHRHAQCLAVQGEWSMGSSAEGNL